MRNSLTSLSLGLLLGTIIGYHYPDEITSLRAGGRVVSDAFLCCIDYPHSPCTQTPEIPDCRKTSTVATKGDRLDRKDPAQ